MKKMFMLGAAAAALMTAGTANATKIFTVSGTFTNTSGRDAGSLNGTIATNDAMTALESYSLVSSKSGVFDKVTYTDSTSNWVLGGLPNTNLSGAAFTISSLFTGYALTLQFPLPLTQPVTTLGSLSGESQRRNGIFVDVRSLSGTITAAVPEPATWAMMLLGFGMVAATARYRRKTSVVTYA